MKGCKPAYFLFLIVSLLLISNKVVSQTRTQLESKREALLKEIEATAKVLEQARATKSDASSRIDKLEAQIERRNELLSNLCESVDALDNQAIQSNTEAVALQKQLDRLKFDYRQVMQTAYRRHLNYHYYLMLLSSKTINNFLSWVLYIKQFDKFTEEKLTSIMDNHKSLMDNIYNIQSTKQKKLNLVKEQESQQTKISTEIAEKNDLMAQMTQKESALVEKVQQKQNEKAKIDKKIEEIILAEIKASKEKLAKTAKKTTKTVGTKKTELKNTPVVDTDSKSFELNKGKFPWPVNKAVIMNGFGRQEHPTVKGIFTNNKGVYVKTEKSAEVHAIYKGTVIATLSSPAYKECVLVKHGNFFTLYANLDEVFVKRDNVINAKQAIGKVAYEDTYNCPILYFEIWKGESPLNPEQWLISL